MDSNWAAEHLQVIRTLMERSTVYRRALAPIMVQSGALGLLAAGAGLAVKIESPAAFVAYWMATGLAAVAGAFLLVRRQALREAESFWSPPTRRVAQALVPPFLFGLVLGIVALAHSLGHAAPNLPTGALALTWLPLIWVGLYGCGLHAAGFFMPRGMKLFGLAFVLGSSAFCFSGFMGWLPPALFGHAIMGTFFGLFHLAYGLYLYFTEPRAKVS